MVIGDSFPPEKRKAYIDRSLKAWRVISLYCTDIDSPHDKFLLIITASPYVLYFFISTDPYNLAISNPKMKDTQVCIDVKDHPFLTYDSFIDCSQVRSLPTYEVERQLMADIGRVKDVISGRMQAAVIRAVKANVRMNQRQKTMILSFLNASPRRGK